MEKTIQGNLEELGNLLEEIYTTLSKEQGSWQVGSDVEAGRFLLSSGLYVSLEIQSFVCDFCDLYILRAYSQLFQKVLASENELFVPLSLRILQDLGIKKIDIFFSGMLIADELNRIKLILTLSDYALLSGYIKHRAHFVKLFLARQDQLDHSEQAVFQDAYQYLITNSDRLPIELLKKLNKTRDVALNKAIKKIPPSHFIKKLNLDWLWIIWSGFMHGNPLMLEQVFNEEIAQRTKNRVRAVLWFTGQNTLYRITPFMKDPVLRKRVEEMMAQGDKVWDQLTDEWRVESKKTE